MVGAEVGLEITFNMGNLHNHLFKMDNLMVRMKLIEMIDEKGYLIKGIEDFTKPLGNELNELIINALKESLEFEDVLHDKKMINNLYSKLFGQENKIRHIGMNFYAQIDEIMNKIYDVALNSFIEQLDDQIFHYLVYNI